MPERINHSTIYISVSPNKNTYLQNIHKNFILAIMLFLIIEYKISWRVDRFLFKFIYIIYFIVNIFNEYIIKNKSITGSDKNIQLKEWIIFIAELYLKVISNHILYLRKDAKEYF